jgi:hypothetical protein
MRPDYYVGLDLGQTTDFTALAVLERPPADGGAGDGPAYALRHLERFPLGTPYTAIVPAATRLANAAPGGAATLVVDQTGVGRAVVDLLRRAPGTGRIVPVTITGGLEVAEQEDGSYHVPKKELVTCLQLLLQSRRLKVARTLPHADTLVQELSNFRVKITEALHETFGAWREGEHDDLVLAVALAAWLAEREPAWGPDCIGYGRDNPVLRAPEGVFLPEGHWGW